MRIPGRYPAAPALRHVLTAKDRKGSGPPEVHPKRARPRLPLHRVQRGEMTRFVDLIAAKRAGEVLSRSQISEAIGEFVAGRIPDYQMAAFLMAVCWRGMSNEET